MLASASVVWTLLALFAGEIFRTALSFGSLPALLWHAFGSEALRMLRPFGGSEDLGNMHCDSATKGSVVHF